MTQVGDDRPILAPSRPFVWIGLAGLLLAWNGLTALYASPLTLTQWYDGIQYQLLARNRLHGHDEVGDKAHTVGREGRHPMWRPGLVWIEEGLATVAGSVRGAAALASALGTTLMELAMLWLAWRCFGVRSWLVVVTAVLVPWPVGAWLLGLAIGQGPEPWAAAAILLGLGGFVEAVRRQSGIWGFGAGLVAGGAEWLRTGTTLLFAAPWLVYALVFLFQRRWKELELAAAGAAGLLIATVTAGWVVPSPVNKTVANLWHNLAENEGPLLTENVAGVGWVTFSMGGYRIVPGTQETYNDYIVRSSREVSSREFLEGRGRVIFPLYLDRLGEALASGVWGLRWLLGDIVLGCFLFQIAMGAGVRTARSHPGELSARRQIETTAFALAALGYYFGPVVLLRGAAPSHYLLLALPLFVIVAARGAVTLAEMIGALCQSRLPALAERARVRQGFALVLLAALLISLSGHYYLQVLTTLREYQDRANTAQAAVDSLQLAGKTIACRNMSWFVDRDVRTVLLPYATVPELEAYARARDIDGILVWDDETQLFFRATPYASLNEFDRAMRKSSVFAPPQVAGAWHWYPMRTDPSRSRLSAKGRS
jgi:hypothetical protein